MKNSYNESLIPPLWTRLALLLAGLFLVPLAAHSQIRAKEAPAASNADGWHQHDQFGWFFRDGNSPNLYHENMGWLYEVPVDNASSFFHNPRFGWWFIAHDSFPWIWSVSQGTWVFRQVAEHKTYFYNVATGRWGDEELQEDVIYLLDLMKKYRGESEVTPEMIKELAFAMRSAWNDAVLPDADLVTDLAVLYAEIWNDEVLTPEEKILLTEAVMAVLNSSNITDEEIEAIVAQVRVIAEASHIDEEELDELTEAWRAVAESTRDFRKERWQQIIDSIDDDIEEKVVALLKEVQRLQNESEVTPLMIARLADSIKKATDDAVRPDDFLVDVAAELLLLSLQDGELTEEEKAELIAAVIDILESSNITEDEIEEILARISVVLEASNIDREDIDALRTAWRDLLKAIGDSRNAIEPGA